MSLHRRSTPLYSALVSLRAFWLSYCIRWRLSSLQIHFQNSEKYSQKDSERKLQVSLIHWIALQGKWAARTASSPAQDLRSLICMFIGCRSSGSSKSNNSKESNLQKCTQKPKVPSLMTRCKNYKGLTLSRVHSNLPSPSFHLRDYCEAGNISAVYCSILISATAEATKSSTATPFNLLSNIRMQRQKNPSKKIT